MSRGRQILNMIKELNDSVIEDSDQDATNDSLENYISYREKRIRINKWLDYIPQETSDTIKTKISKKICSDTNDPKIIHVAKSDSENTSNSSVIIENQSLLLFDANSDDELEKCSDINSLTSFCKKNIDCLNDSNDDIVPSVEINHLNEFLEDPLNNASTFQSTLRNGNNELTCIPSEQQNNTNKVDNYHNIECNINKDELISENQSKREETCKMNIYQSPYLPSKKYKRTTCKFCDDSIISRHFARHLERKHMKEASVMEILNSNDKTEKRHLLAVLRNEGNFDNALRGEVIPKRRQNNTPVSTSEYAICIHCKTYNKKKSLSRHVKRYFMSVNTEKGRALSLSQTYSICVGAYGDFLLKLKIKEQVFSIMKNDDISKVVQKDPLICLYGENLLKKHRRKQIRTVISNKLRECGRFLMEMEKLGNHKDMLSTLKPQFCDQAILAVKIMSGYNVENQTFNAPSLAMHMGTTLKQIAELTTKLVLRNHCMIQVQNTEQCLTDLARYKEIVTTQWTTELSSLAMKDLTAKSSVKPRLLPITEDIMKLREYVCNKAECAYCELSKSKNNVTSYKILSETTLVLTIIHNRKRVASYKNQINNTPQQEFTSALSESEKILTQHYKRIVAIGKGSRGVTILIPRQLQKFFALLLKIRKDTNLVPSDNKYLFTYPKSQRWINGCSVLRKYAKLCGAKYPELITSSRLRKHIATVTQLLNLKENEIDQLAKFMGHTKKTHESFYKLPQDIYQVAKISKILQMMEQGKATNFKNKSLEEIDIDMDETIEQEVDDENKENDIPNSTKLVVECREPDLESNRSLKKTKFNQNKEKIKLQECKQGNGKILDETTGESDSESDTILKKRKECPVKRHKWSEEEIEVIKKCFSAHIKNKKNPKKDEVLKVMKNNSKIFHRERNWVTIKAFVYNCYHNP